MKRFISILVVIFCVFSLLGCSENNEKPKNDAELTAEEIAKKNSKEILGSWVVESKELSEAKTLGEGTAVVMTKTMFPDKSEIKFLSNGTFSSGIYNLEYEIVDDQFIYKYKDNTCAYDCEINGDTMILSIVDILKVTLKKK